MCQSVYRHYTGCGCELYAYLWKCEHGPRSPLCTQRSYAVVEKKDMICKYHDYINYRPSTTRRRRRPAPNDFPLDRNQARPRDDIPPHRRDRDPNRSSDDDRTWISGRPDIDRRLIKWTYAQRGRVNTGEKSSRLRSGIDYNPLAGDSSEDECDYECPGCDDCAPYDMPLRRRTYAEGYNSDSWEDLYHPGYACGNDDTEEEAAARRDRDEGEQRPKTRRENLVGIGARTVARAREQREARERARIGSEHYDHRQRLAAQQRRAERAHADYVDAVVEHQQNESELRAAIRRSEQEARARRDHIERHEGPARMRHNIESDTEVFQELSNDEASTDEEDEEDESSSETEE